MPLKLETVTEKPKRAIVSTSCVTTTLTTLAISTQIPPKLIAAAQDGTPLVELKQQAASVTSGDEVRRNLLQEGNAQREQLTAQCMTY